MQKLAIAYCGQIRGAELFHQALRPALALRAEGKIHHILLSTWCGELELYPGGANTLREQGIEVIESKFPERLAVPGNVFQQMFSLDRALDYLDEDCLVLRTRPDVVFFETSALEAVLQRVRDSVTQSIPNDVFTYRIWVPFFMPSIPFYACDQIFFGRAGDLRKLNNYDMLPEAYQLSSRTNEQVVARPSTPAAEIRRFLGPFVTKYPILREYQFVWPKFCIETSLFQEICMYNYRSDMFREYMAIWLRVVDTYFVVGGAPGASGKVGMIRDPRLSGAINVTLVEDDTLPSNLGVRLALAGGGGYWPQRAYGSAWLRQLVEAPDSDPLGAVMFREPLERAAAYKNDSARRAQFTTYLQGLWSLADRPNVPF